MGRRRRAPERAHRRSTRRRWRGCAQAARPTSARARGASSSDAPLGPGGERVYPGTCRDGIPADRAAARSAPGAFASATARVDYCDRLQGRSGRTSRATSATSSCAAPTASTPTSSPSSSTTRCRASPTSSAAPTCSRRRRARSACSACSGSRRRRTCTCRSPSTRTGEKLSKQTRAAPLPDDPLPALLAAWRFLDQPLPADRAAPARSPNSGPTPSPPGRRRACRRCRCFRRRRRSRRPVRATV